MIDPNVAKRVKVIGIDVDGVMTDGGVYVGTADGRPVELKRFDILDNVGVRMARAAGIKVVVISGRESPATTLRAAELQTDDLVQDDMAVKLRPFELILAKYGATMEEAAFIGDDLPDLAVLQRVGLPVVVANATAEVREVAAYITAARGGHGAVREFCENLLRARGEWDGLVQQYLAERGGKPPGNDHAE